MSLFQALCIRLEIFTHSSPEGASLLCAEGHAAAFKILCLTSKEGDSSEKKNDLQCGQRREEGNTHKLNLDSTDFLH